MNQQELVFGKALRDDGMKLAVEAEGQEWADRAFLAIIDVALAKPTVHVNDVLEIFPDPPRHHNAWGAVWMRAIRAGVIQRTGTTAPCVSAQKHARQAPVYRSEIRKAA